MDPMHLQIYKTLHPRRGNLDEDLIKTIAANLTFLTKHIVGSAIHPSQVSIPIIYVAAVGAGYAYHKASVCVHQGLGKCTIVVSEQVVWGKDVVMALAGKVDLLVNEILSEEEKVKPAPVKEEHVAKAADGQLDWTEGQANEWV